MHRPSLERALKLQWHDDLVANPVAHAWVLNLYRAGERHPETVSDYFPAHLSPWPWLAEALQRHRRDEARHAAMFATAIRALDGTVRDDVRDFDVFNEVIRACTPAGFRPPPGAPEGARREALAHFLAHAHFLELRVARSLGFHLEACERGGALTPARVAAAVLRDESRHAGYTRTAVYELLTRPHAQRVLDLHRRAEARANLLFSERQVRTFLAHHAGLASLGPKLAYRAMATLQHLAAHHVYADE